VRHLTSRRKQSCNVVHTAPTFLCPQLSFAIQAAPLTESHRLSTPGDTRLEYTTFLAGYAAMLKR
jgi:hypothetical protein